MIIDNEETDLIRMNPRIWTDIISEISDEFEMATDKFLPFNTAHEGYAVILEELDELWNIIKTKEYTNRDERMREEAIQIATMAIRFIINITMKNKPPKGGDTCPRE